MLTVIESGEIDYYGYVDPTCSIDDMEYGDYL